MNKKLLIIALSLVLLLTGCGVEQEITMPTATDTPEATQTPEPSITATPEPTSKATAEPSVEATPTRTADPRKVTNLDKTYTNPELYTYDGEYIYFGSYPQSIWEAQSVPDQIKIESLENNNDGDEIEYEGEKYRVCNGKCYKYEPIRWQIVEETEDSYFLMSDFILDCMAYNEEYYFVKKEGVWGEYSFYRDSEGLHHATDYDYSDIRKWLNEVFYNEAFDEDEKAKIRLTLVDNHTDIPSVDTELFSPDTEDYVFLLSDLEMTGRKVIANSDYSAARGLAYHSSRGRGRPYWTRTTYRDSWTMYYLGTGNGYTACLGYVTNTSNGVVPGIVISK